MQTEDFAYIRTTQKAFDEAVATVQEKTKDKGFRVMSVHDVKATLAERGFQHEPLTIIEL